ncbi:MAG TPA: aspartate/glutamate racemase family protein [Methylomirabilota bacterium]|nr:aspartate/glutamate racemase family protein [Methylomirabilota bacterium]
MRVLVANPNSTGAITQACVDLARQTASPGTAIIGWTNDAGPPVVDSVYADYLAGSALVRGLVGLRPVPDAVVLAGFGNYGTAAVKEALSVSVVSMAEAAMAVGGLLCHRFVIVTTSPRMVPYTEDLIRLAGFDHRCAGVRAVALPPVGEPAPPGDAVVAELAAQVGRAEGELRADLVILGGARLSPYAAELRRRVRMPVIEPVACAVQVAEGLVRLDLRQSKTGRFAPPPALSV